MNTRPILMPNALESHAKQRRSERMILATGALGVAAAAAALWWPVADGPSTIVPLKPVVIPTAPPSVAPTTAAPIEIAPQPIVATAPTIALPHEEPGDHQQRAEALVASGDVEGALVALRKHAYSAAPTPELLLQIARLAEGRKEYALAEQALLDAGALAPDSAHIAIERGKLLLEIGELDQARQAARLAIRLDKESASAWNLAGRVAMAASEWDRAELSFRQAVQRQPTDAMLHNNLGLLYVVAKKGELAVDALETSRELTAEETPAFVHNNLGLAYELTGRWAEAREAFEAALTKSPDYARAQVNLRRVIEAEERAAEQDEAATMAAELEVL